MKRFFSESVFLTILLTCFSCTAHDPSYESVERPEINVENSVIMGTVSDLQGNALAGAVVDVSGVEVSTDGNGMYRIEITTAGTYELSASYPDKITKNSTVEVPDVKVTHNYVRNFSLPEYRTIVLGSGENVEVTETIPDNEQEGTMTVTATVVIEETTLPEDEYLTLTPVYSKKDGEDIVTSQTKATTSRVENKMFIGAIIACSDPSITELSVPAKMSFDAVKEVQEVTKLMMYDIQNGIWVEIPYESSDNEIVFEVKYLTAYGIFGDVTVVEEEKVQPITDFKPQAFWDNYYGKDLMHVGAVTYTTKVGMNLDRKQGVDQLRALLLEKLAQDYGLGDPKDVPATYNVNTDLPVGTSLELTGSQNLLNVKYEMNGKSVHADVFGTASVSGKTFNRVHTGGGNNTNY